MSLERLNFMLTSEQISLLRFTSQQNEISVSEVLRRLVDYTFQEPYYGRLFPFTSGKLRVDG